MNPWAKDLKTVPNVNKSSPVVCDPQSESHGNFYTRAPLSQFITVRELIKMYL